MKLTIENSPLPVAAIPVAIYTRVSTAGQLGGRFDSCATQEAVCRDYGIFFGMLHCGLVASAVWQLWPRLIDSYHAADARIAFLAFAVVHLISLLLAFNVNLPLRQELMHLRRQIGFGELDAAQARQKLFELIYGSELSVLLRSRFEDTEKSLQALEGAPEDAEQALLLASESSNRAQSLAEAKAKMVELEKKHSQLEGNWADLWVRIMICRWTGGVPADVATQETSVDVRVKAVAEKLTALRACLKSLG